MTDKQEDSKIVLSFNPGIVLKYKPVKQIEKTLNDRTLQLEAIDIRDLAKINAFLIDNKICTFRELGISPSAIVKQMF